jgi:hypothetical protein
LQEQEKIEERKHPKNLKKPTQKKLHKTTKWKKKQKKKRKKEIYASLQA